MEPSMNEQLESMALHQAAHAHMMGVAPGLAVLQPNAGAAMHEDGQDSVAKFKPIDLERLSPK